MRGSARVRWACMREAHVRGSTGKGCHALGSARTARGTLWLRLVNCQRWDGSMMDCNERSGRTRELLPLQICYSAQQCDPPWHCSSAPVWGGEKGGADGRESEAGVSASPVGAGRDCAGKCLRALPRHSTAGGTRRGSAGQLVAAGCCWLLSAPLPSPKPTSASTRGLGMLIVCRAGNKNSRTCESGFPRCAAG